MTQEQIIERNRDIALMLGWTYNSFNDRWNDNMLHEYSYLRMDELKFHSDWNFLMHSVEFIKENVKTSNNTKNAKINELFIDEWEFKINTYYVRLIQWTKDGWRMFGKENRDLSLLYIIGENCKNEKEAIFLIISNFAKLYNNYSI